MKKCQNQIKKKLQLKITILCMAFVVLIGIIISCLGYVTYSKNMHKQYQAYARDMLNLIKSNLDTDGLVESQKTGKINEASLSAHRYIRNIYEASAVNEVYLVYFSGAEKKEELRYLMYADNGDENAPIEDLIVLNKSCKEGDFDTNMRELFYTCLYENKSMKSEFALVINDTSNWGYQLTEFTALKDSNGKPVFVVAVDIGMESIKKVLNQYIHVAVLGGAVLLCLFLFILIWAFNKMVVRPVEILAENAQDFVNQTGEKRLPESLVLKSSGIHSGDEIELLSESLYHMTKELKAYMIDLEVTTKEKEGIRAELNVANQIQADMLPRIFPYQPDREEFDLYAVMDPAKEVGGDFYDFFMIDQNHLAIVIGDVAGKGVPAALFMVISKTIIKNYAMAGLMPDEVFTKANEELCEGNEAELFTTAWFGIWETNTGRLLFADAGHDNPLKRLSDGTISYIKPKKKRLMLAGMEGTKYILNEATLMPGELFLLYTDGVPEATDANYQLYGQKRLVQVLQNQQRANPKQLLTAIAKDVDEFVGNAPQFDDLTMLALEINCLTEKEKDIKCLKFEVNEKNMDGITSFVEQELKQAGCAPKVMAQILISVDELYSNIVKYSQATAAQISVEIAQQEVFLVFKDNGIPYNPLEQKEPDITLPLEERQIGGLGIWVVKKSMDSVTYDYVLGKNIVSLKKNMD